MSDRQEQEIRQELPGGGTLAYRIDTDNDEIRGRLRSKIAQAVGAVREQSRIDGVGDPEDARFEKGAELLDCGDPVTIQDVRSVEGSIVYDVEYDNGEEASVLASEVELGIIDGTIQAIP